MKRRLATLSITAALLALAAGEQIEVTVDRGPRDDDPSDPVARRRALLSRVLAAIEAQGGAPTVGDLAGALDVSSATVRRDLAALREAGVDAVTRGGRAG